MRRYGFESRPKPRHNERRRKFHLLSLICQIRDINSKSMKGCMCNSLQCIKTKVVQSKCWLSVIVLVLVLSGLLCKRSLILKFLKCSLVYFHFVNLHNKHHLLEILCFTFKCIKATIQTPTDSYAVVYWQYLLFILSGDLLLLGQSQRLLGKLWLLKILSGFSSAFQGSRVKAVGFWSINIYMIYTWIYWQEGKMCHQYSLLI